MPKNLSNLGGLLFALIAIFVLFAKIVPNNRFQSLDNIETIARQSVIVCLVSLGSAYVIISAGIDLSVGSAAACSSVTVAASLAWLHLSPATALIIGILTGVGWGLINGILVTKLGVGPFIVTLSTYLIVRAAATGIAHENAIYGNPTWLDSLVSDVGKRHAWMLMPVGVWLTLLLAIIMSICLKYTRFGRHVVAVGSNEMAAKLCGVPVNRVKLAVYAISGAFAGLAGVMLYSRLTEGDPTAAQGLELSAIAAVVIGGASLNGGEGSIMGAIIGALIMQVISSGSAEKGLPNWVQQIVTGIIILIAVGLDRWRARRSLLSSG